MTAPLPAGVRGIDGRATIDQVVPSVGRALGVTDLANSLELPEAARYVVFLVDGLGLELLEAHGELAPFLSLCTSVPDVVCGVPSTTATSLTSLGTGVRPGQHGMVGYTSRVPETGARMNLLKWDQPVDPLQWQPVPTVFERMLEAGVEAASVNQARFADTELTICSQRGVPFHGVDSMLQRHDVVLDVIESAPRSMAYAYESRLDHTGHAHGVDSQEWRDMLSTVDREIEALRRDLPSDALLLVTADHGMIDLPADDRFDVDTEPELLDDVVLIAGEARFRHLYTRAGAEAEVASRWRARLGDAAVVATRDEAVGSDWFGPVSPQVAGRLGDVMVASLGSSAVFSSVEFPIENLMTGFHGSITEAELRVPVLIA